MNIIHDILKFLNLKSIPTHISHLGTPSLTPIKPRPIKDQNDVFKLFSSQHKLKSNSSWKDLRFSSGCTKQQQDHKSQLRQELLRRRSVSKANLILKFIRGIPTIINSKN